MAKRKLNIWDAIAWLALISIFIWVTLKVLGIIKTPLWLEYAPIYSATYVAGWAMHKLSVLSNDVKDLERFKDETIKQINEIKTNCVKNHYR